MELKKHLNLKKVFVGLYVLAFAVYIIIGLQPAEAVNYEIATELKIPAIGLVSDVTELAIENGELNTPDTIVGSYSRSHNKTLLIGHSTTVFENLKNVELNQEITYNDNTYRVVAIDKMQKSDINMTKLLMGANKDTIVIMTCAGELLDGGDATHRLIITAIATN